MNSEEIKLMINQYFDGELDKNREPLLFTLLSNNDQGREYFKNMNMIKETVKQNFEEFPSELEERILFSVEDKSSKTSKGFFEKRFASVASYAFTIVLLVLSIFLYLDSREYKSQLELTIQAVNEKNNMINLLLNSLPSAEVRGELENPIIIRATM